MRKIIIVFLLLLSESSFSEENVTAWGVGALSCGEWLEWRQQNHENEQLLQWVFGFISGHNYYSNAPDVRPPDAPAALAFVDTYCRNNPLHIVTVAGAALTQELGGKQAKHQWKR